MGRVTGTFSGTQGVGRVTTNTGADAFATIISEAMNSFGKSLENAMMYNANAAAEANRIQWAMMKDQQAFNADQASQANAFTQHMWDQQAAFNQSSAQWASQFNAEEADKQRKWQEYMASTAYQRTVKDLQKAGLNPIMAVSNGATAGGSGAVSSIGAPSVGGASGQAAASGMGSAIAENTGTDLAKYGALFTAMDGVVSAMSALGRDKKTMNRLKGTIKGLFK